MSGVLQGCPASGMLFNSALDPFLFAFCSALGNGSKGIIRGCADDIGFALSGMKHLNLLYPIYQQAEALAGLALHPSKCVLVPLCDISEHQIHTIKGWLQRHFVPWSGFKIERAAKFLGFYVGPDCGKINWNGPLGKLQDRVKQIK